MKKYLVKIIYLVLIIISLFKIDVFADDLSLSLFYGINNVAKNGSLLPIEIKVENRENVEFNGYINISIYESNKSVFLYRLNLNCKPKEKIVKTTNVSVANKSNTLIIEIFNNRDELVTTERTNIDLSYYDDKIIIGAITEDFDSLKYIDDNSFYNNTLRTKLVEINEELYDNNKNILDILDVLLISDINLSKMSEGFNFAISSFINKGKPVIISLGGKNGIFALPNSLNYLLDGPSFDEKVLLDLSKENVQSSFTTNVTRIALSNAKDVFEFGDILVKNINTNNLFLLFIPFSLNELSELKENNIIFTTIVEGGLGNAILDKIVDNIGNEITNDYYNINYVLNMIEKIKLPDIFLLTTFLTLYIVVITILIYIILRNMGKREYYGKIVIISSIIFSFIMFFIGYKNIKKNAFLDYISIVDLNDTSSYEKSFLKFRTSESGSYSFNTSANNKLYPILKTNNEPILSTNFMELEKLKATSIYQNENRYYVDVENASDFDENLFVYEANNYVSDQYDVNVEINRYDGMISGKVTNNMKTSIKDASIMCYGRIIKIGELLPGTSVTLKEAKDYITPINNNSMLSEILNDDNNQNIIKYYLDNNTYNYFDFALFMGFLDGNKVNSTYIISNDISDINGRIFLSKKVAINSLNIDDSIDIATSENEIENIYGNYDKENNSIKGDEEVLNKYSFDKNVEINKIYFENLSSFDNGDIDSNVPYYGSISLFNIYTQNFDTIYNDYVDVNNVSEYINENNEILIKFNPLSRDPLYRNISLPYVRAIGIKIDRV